MMHRRAFLTRLGQAGLLALTPPLWMGRQPPADAPFRVHIPDFMAAYIPDGAVAYLNETIPALFTEYAAWFPVMAHLPQVIVLNTLQDALIAHGSEVIFPAILGDEALTLAEAQYLLVTTRFGSVATPHRGPDLDRFGQVIYLKQHPQTGYRTPPHLLLEELIHAQQDMSVMRAIIERDQLNAVGCLHAELKGISELAAHVLTDPLAGEPDYVFVMDDGTHCDTADEGLSRLAARLNTDDTTLLAALLYDADTYFRLDAGAMRASNRHIWQMVTTWRHARDENGNPTDIAPAFMPYTYTHGD